MLHIYTNIYISGGLTIDNSHHTTYIRNGLEKYRVMEAALLPSDGIGVTWNVCEQQHIGMEWGEGEA